MKWDGVKECLLQKCDWTFLAFIHAEKWELSCLCSALGCVSQQMLELHFAHCICIGAGYDSGRCIADLVYDSQACGQRQEAYETLLTVKPEDHPAEQGPPSSGDWP